MPSAGKHAIGTKRGNTHGNRRERDTTFGFALIIQKTALKFFFFSHVTFCCIFMQTAGGTAISNEAGLLFELRDAKKKVAGKAKISIQEFFKGMLEPKSFTSLLGVSKYKF